MISSKKIIHSSTFIYSYKLFHYEIIWQYSKQNLGMSLFHTESTATKSNQYLYFDIGNSWCTKTAHKLADTNQLKK